MGRVLLAAPRSFCAGVDRAMQIVERLLEEHGAGLVHHPRGIHHRPARKPVERPREPVRHDVALRHAVHAPQADERRPQPGPPRGPSLRSRRAGRRQPVKLQAMLLALSLMLDAASNAAEGSKPEWIPQCSQRGSLPGPYASHSIPSRSAS